MLEIVVLDIEYVILVFHVNLNCCLQTLVTLVQIQETLLLIDSKSEMGFSIGVLLHLDYNLDAYFQIHKINRYIEYFWTQFHMKMNGSQILLLTDMVDSNSHQILEEETMVMELDSKLGNFDFFHDFDEDSSVDQTSFYFLCAFWFDFAFKFSFTKFQFVIFTDVRCSMYISLHIFLEFIYCCEKFNEIMLWKQIVTKTQYFTQLIQLDFDNFFFTISITL